MRHIGQIKVSDLSIIQALHMPETTGIIGATFDPNHRTITLIVEHDALEPIVENATPPLYNPEITHHHEKYEWNWGKSI